MDAKTQRIRAAERQLNESSETTEIYTHITHKGWDKIKSPIDDLNL